MSRDRDEFSPLVKQIIAGRAGYKCSFPGCSKVLIGPGKENDKTVLIGECAHIFSAADGGPRGKSFLTKEKIESPENGIFLCRNHHKIIDANKGSQYSPQQLLSYKTQHETEIAREMGNYPININWISDISISFREVFRNNISIKLGKITHLYGTNNSGKSVFCKCIYDSCKLEKKYINEAFQVSFTFMNVPGNDLVYEYRNDGNGEYIYNEKKFPLNPLNVDVIFLCETISLSNDNVQDVANVFSVSTELILSLLRSEEFKTKIQIKIERERPYLKRTLLIKNLNGINIRMNHCSTAEKCIFLFEVGIVLARYLSRKSTVLYIIDWGNVGALDNKRRNQLIKKLESNKNVFQTILISPDEMPELEWNGWEIAKFKNTTPNTEVSQNDF